VPRFWERVLGALCYLGAIRIPQHWIIFPDWWSLPAGLSLIVIVWVIGQGSPFLRHHARWGLIWTLIAHGVLFTISLFSAIFYYAGKGTGIGFFLGVWNLIATFYWWGLLVIFFLSVWAASKALQGKTDDLFVARS
jgi:hypothetical protein